MAGKRRSDDPSAPLTPSEGVFVEEYLIDLNGTRAYRAAFPGSGCETAKVGASRLLSKANVRAEIAAARRAQQKRTRLSADQVLRELARIAFSDVFDLFDNDGNMRPVARVPLDTRCAISAVKVSRVRTTTRVTQKGKTTTRVTVETSVLEYKLSNKVDALGKLAAFLGLSTPLPPLEVLLAAFPPALAAQVRQALAAPAR